MVELTGLQKVACWVDQKVAYWVVVLVGCLVVWKAVPLDVL